MMPFWFLCLLSLAICQSAGESICDDINLPDLMEVTDITFPATCTLSEIPAALCTLPQLQRLTFDGQAISQLPPCFIDLQHQLKSLLFFSAAFREFPAVLRHFSNLSMLSLKGSLLRSIPEKPPALSPSIQWLILTSNQLTGVPESIGQLTRLRKFMLASNQLTALPATLCECEDLELIRLPNNHVAALPECLWNMSRLAWVGLANNPISPNPPAPPHMEINYTMTRVLSLQRLGGGASGDVYADILDGRDVVVKIFKGLSSDGRAEDEVVMAAQASAVPGVLRTLAFFRRPAWGMVMEALPGFVPLAGPPSMASMTRDVYRAGTVLSVAGLRAVAQTVAAACVGLHAAGIMHGDLYAHNILVHPRLLQGSPNVSGADVRLSDFGAASRPGHAAAFRWEVRAFGILLRELMAHTVLGGQGQLAAGLERLARHCMHSGTRPGFSEIAAQLEVL